MEFFQAAQHVHIFTSGTFSDSYGNIHRFNHSVHTTHTDSCDRSSPALNHFVDNPQPLINETARGVPDEIEEGGKVEEVDDTEGVPSDDNLPIDGKFQFVNCQSVSVYMNAFNTSGVKVEDCGNIFPQFTHHGGTVIVHPSNDKLPPHINGSPSSSKSFQPETAFGQSSEYQGAPSDSTSGSPSMIPPLLVQLREDSSSYPSTAQSGPPSVPAVGIPSGSRSSHPVLNLVPLADIPLPTSKRGKLPATIETKSMQARMPAPTTLSGPAFQPFPMNPDLPIHMGLHPNFLSHILQPFLDDSQQSIPHPRHYPVESLLATESLRDPPNTNLKHFEHLLESALATALIIQTSGISSWAETLTPQAQNTLKALNALVSAETPIYSSRATASDPMTRKRVAKRLRSPQS